MLRVAVPSSVGLLLVTLLAVLPAEAGNSKEESLRAVASWISSGPVMVLAEAAEVELGSASPGGTSGPRERVPDRIYVQDCRDWAEGALGALAPALQDAGLPVAGRFVLSVGQLIDPAYPCHALESRRTDRHRNVRDLAPSRAPYFEQGVLRTRVEARREWNALVRSAWEADVRARPSATAVPPCPVLRRALATDVAVVLIGQGRRVPFVAGAAPGIPDEVLRARKRSGPFSFRDGAAPGESSSSRIVLAVVDLAGGRLLWAGESVAGEPLVSRRDFRGLARHFTTRMKHAPVRDPSPEPSRAPLPAGGR